MNISIGLFTSNGISNYLNIGLEAIASPVNEFDYNSWDSYLLMGEDLNVSLKPVYLLCILFNGFELVLFSRMYLFV